jgi:ankyrin repeat protein
LRKDNLRKHMRLVHKPKEAEEDLEEFQALYGESISHQRQAMTDSPLLSALLIAARNGSVWTVGRLIAKGAPLAESTADGKTVLHAAAMSGSEQLTRLLIDAGVDCSRQDNNGNSALHDAAAQGHAGVIRVLAKAGIPLSIANKRGETALHLAVARSCEASTRNLLEHGANPDTPKILCRAAEKGVERIAKLLIQGGTPIETQGGSALQVASRTGHIGVVKLMLDQGVPLNLNYKGQGTALYHASIAGHKKVVKLLLTQGAVEYERERGGRHGTALLAALAEGHHKVAELIMSQPEHHFARELAEELDAALAEALSRGHDKIVELLLVKGTHIISLRTFVGVLEMASALGHERIIDVLPTRVVCEGKTVIASTIRSENDGKFTVHCSNATVSYYQKMTKAKGRLGILPLPYIDARKAAGLFDLDRPCSDGKWIQPDTVRKVTKGRHDNTIAKIICK